MMTPTVLVRKTKITFFSHTSIATSKLEIDTIVEASYSAVLTLASYILFNHPNLAPPNRQSETYEFQDKDQSYPQMHLTHNKLYEPWCDFLGELILKKSLYQIDQICHFFSNASEAFIQKLSKSVFSVQNNETSKDEQKQDCNSALNKIIETFYSSNQLNIKEIKKQKKIAIVNFSTSQLRQDKLQPKMHLTGLFAGIFYNQGDMWKIYNVLSNQYPTEDQYQELDTLMLSGSSLSVNDNDPCVCKFTEELKKALQKNKQLKVLGICFGHQLIARMFGGTVIKKHLLTGVQRIIFDQKILSKATFFQRTELDKNEFQLSEYHQDFVEVVPQKFHVLAQSATCKAQALISNNGRFLSFQFHPQYSAEYIKAFEARACQYCKHHNVKSCYSHKQIGGISHDQSLIIIRKVIRNFLNWSSQQMDLNI